MTEPMSKEVKEIDVFVKNEYLVMDSYSTTVSDFSLAWYENHINHAYFDIADKNNTKKPHAFTLSMYGGKVSKHDLFVLEKRSNWKLKCFVFENNMKLKQWIANVGPEMVVHEVFL